MSIEKIQPRHQWYPCDHIGGNKIDNIIWTCVCEQVLLTKHLSLTLKLVLILYIIIIIVH